MAEAVISECNVGDLDDSLKKLWLALVRESSELHLFILPSETNSDTWCKFVHDGLVKRTNLLFVAKIQGRSIGFVYVTIFRDYAFEVSEPVAVVNDLYVSPDHRRRGVGTKLMTECMKRLKAEGMKGIRLTVLSGNTAALGLYQKLGFRTYTYGMQTAPR
jgi:ribosomal protein S18 acetylase RimI-like enzyme